MGTLLILLLIYSVIRNKDVRHVSVPQYEGLTIEKIAKFINDGHQEVYQYLPDQQEI